VRLLLRPAAHVHGELLPRRRLPLRRAVLVRPRPGSVRDPLLVRAVLRAPVRPRSEPRAETTMCTVESTIACCDSDVCCPRRSGTSSPSSTSASAATSWSLTKTTRRSPSTTEPASTTNRARRPAASATASSRRASVCSCLAYGSDRHRALTGVRPPAALHCPFLPCPTLSCPPLSCPVLPCPALPCPALPCPSSRDRYRQTELGYLFVRISKVCHFNPGASARSSPMVFFPT